MSASFLFEMYPGCVLRQAPHNQTNTLFPTRRSSDLVTHLFGMITDITVMVELKKRIEYLATYDELTSLPNVHSLDRDRKSTRLNSSHVASSYAGCCWKKNRPTSQTRGRRGDRNGRLL